MTFDATKNRGQKTSKAGIFAFFASLKNCLNHRPRRGHRESLFLSLITYPCDLRVLSGFLRIFRHASTDSLEANLVIHSKLIKVVKGGQGETVFLKMVVKGKSSFNLKRVHNFKAYAVHKADLSLIL